MRGAVHMAVSAKALSGNMLGQSVVSIASALKDPGVAHRFSARVVRYGYGLGYFSGGICIIP